VTTYVALLDGGRREERLEVRETEPGRYEVALRGELHVVDAFEHVPGTLSLLAGTASHTATIDRRPRQTYVRVGRSSFAIELLDERRLRLRRAGRAVADEGKRTLTAPRPGRTS
jgi:hypothetical protein